MKLLLLVLLGLVSMAMGQEKGAAFLVIDEESDEDNLDVDEILKLEENNTAAGQLKALMRQDSVGMLKEGDFELPPGYDEAIDSGAALFDRNSGKNTATKALAVAPVAADSLLSRYVRQVTNLYYCPHVNYLLRWFPLFNGSTRSICFVPFATRQAITYARCTRPRCDLPNTNRNGLCRPSCFTRRRVLVFCVNFNPLSWGWRWVVRNLPTACRCSTC